VWLLNALLASGAALVYVVWVHPLAPLPAPIRVPWWALALSFVVTEVFVVHIHLRREAHSFSLSDIALVLGLFFTSPQGFILAQLTGATVALLIRRQAPMKFAFNVAHFCLEASVALLVFRALMGDNPLGTWAIVAVFAATFLTSAMGALAITVAISLAEGKLQGQTLFQGLGFGSIVAFTNTCVAILGVQIIWRAPSAVWLFIVPSAILFFAYRTYTVQRQKHEVLELLYESTRSLQRSLRVESTVEALLRQARQMFRAEVSAVTMFSDEGVGIRSTLGPEGESVSTVRIKLDPTEGVWARVAAEDQAILLTRPIESPRLRDHYRARGIRDAMVGPLRGGGRVVGTLLVGNRLGDVSTFDHEDLRVFETLSSHASMSLENARLVGRLKESLAHLTEMNRLKDDFVATVSHELRTPLTSIQGSIKTLLRLDLGPEDEHAMLEAADRGAERLRHLIEDLLMASRIESREVRAEITRVNLDELIAQTIEQIGAEGEGGTVRMELDPDVGEVRTDEGKVAQVLSNLIDNGVKYSPPNGEVVVSAKRDDAGVTISVANNGPPIPADERERVFDRFYQIDQTSTRSVGGAGLGLYICRMLAGAIGGRVWLVRSNEKGTVFSLFIPSTPPVVQFPRDGVAARVQHPKP
jgi:signal transduction histidine kinase